MKVSHVSSKQRKGLEEQLSPSWCHLTTIAYTNMYMCKATTLLTFLTLVNEKVKPAYCVILTLLSLLKSTHICLDSNPGSPSTSREGSLSDRNKKGDPNCWRVQV